MTVMNCNHDCSVLNEKQISDNFSIAKFLSILMVVTGHYFEGTILWVPVSVGLFIFAFSSGYFTGIRNKGRIDLRSFWRNKLLRLFPAVIIIDLFLFILFVIEKKPGLISIHSALALLGMSGILDWLGVHNQSPFGNGLWFFTVLLIFYFIYPILNMACANPIRAYLFIFISAVVCLFGHIYASPPYALWFTIFGFCFGVFVSRLNWVLSKLYAWAGLVIFLPLFILLNLFDVKAFNNLFLVFISVFVVYVLLSTSMEGISTWSMRCFAPCLLEIYFIHTYLFFWLHEFSLFASYFLSIFLVLIIALILYKIRLKVVGCFV